MIEFGCLGALCIGPLLGPFLLVTLILLFAFLVKQLSK